MIDNKSNITPNPTRNKMGKPQENSLQEPVPSNEELDRYSVITQKNPREILLLRGSGCNWRRCRFCDYHLDYSKDDKLNHSLNAVELAKVTGLYNRLEIINSGSFTELPEETMKLIEQVVVAKGISHVHFECHWINRQGVVPLKERFKKIGVEVIVKIGVETFDYNFREDIFCKGIDTREASDIGEFFDECCLLQGVKGQTSQSMIEDIEIGLKHFYRVCVNIMIENNSSIKPDPQVIQIFKDEVYPKYHNNPRVDILMVNTDFGVGGQNKEGK